MRVLIGFDGSSTARAALDEMLRFPWPPGLHVRAVVALGGIEGSSALREVVQQALRNHAAWIEERLRKRWPTARAVVSADPPATALLAESRRMRSDLVVLGWRGHGPIRRLLMGSVSRKIAREAKTAVMVVRGPRERRKDAKRFVLGYDGSHHARRALRFLAKLVPSTGARALILSSLPPLYSPPLSRLTPQAHRLALAGIRKAELAREKRARERLERAAGVLRRCGWSVETLLTSGAPLLSLLEAASTFDADAMVVGARGVSGLERVLLGSVANGALDRSRCPVIVAH
jgi:nucleotide-binding universal stress UspA family protein